MNTIEKKLIQEQRYLTEFLGRSRYEDEYYRIMKRLAEIKIELDKLSESTAV